MPSAILAQTLPDPNSYSSIGWLFVAFAGMAGGLLAIVTLWQKLVPRRTPALEVEFCTKAELAAHRAEINERLTGLSRVNAEHREAVRTDLTLLKAETHGLKVLLERVDASVIALGNRLENTRDKAVAAHTAAEAAARHDH